MMWWPAPGKLNLFLRVLQRRADGYHDLQTAFQFIDLADWLRFEVLESPKVARTEAVAGVAVDQDLSLRAARLLREHAGVRQGVRITLDKRLPIGAGLGGGSSDAATVLVALNRLWDLDLTTEELAALGLQLGADVPVFVRGQAAWAEGVGERLTPMELPEPWFAVVVPPVTVGTASIFSDPELTRHTARMKIADFLDGGGVNDCEAVVAGRYPEVQAALDWLRPFGEPRLTGTGGAVFARFDRQADAEQAVQGLPGSWQGFVVRGQNRSSLARLAAATAA